MTQSTKPTFEVLTLQHIKDDMISIPVESICNMLPGWGWMIVEVPPAEGLLALIHIRMFHSNLSTLGVGDMKIQTQPVIEIIEMPIHTVQQQSEVGMG